MKEENNRRKETQDTIQAFMREAAALKDMQMKFTKEYEAIGDHPVLGGKTAGSDAEKDGARRIAEELKDIGLDNVQLTEIPTYAYQFNDAKLTVIGENGSEKTVMQLGPELSVSTSAVGVEGQLIDSGFGAADFFKNNDVSGKIVLIESGAATLGAELIFFGFAVEEAARRGAAGCLIVRTFDMKTEDDYRTQPFLNLLPIPAASLTIRQSKELRHLLEAGPVNVRLKVDSKVDANGVSLIPSGEIPGSDLADEKIVLTGHLDHYFKCLQDNISSVVTLLAIAKAMKAIGYRPRRTIIFCFDASHEMGAGKSVEPFLSGPWKALQAKGWKNMITNINFEYTALYQEKLRAITSYELMDGYYDFMTYMPSSMPGFPEIDKELYEAKYSILSMVDSGIYKTMGVPCAFNDPITEQMFDHSGPYVGCDHSTADNWEIYDVDCLSANTQWWGAYAIYMDQQTMPHYNFARRMNVSALSDEERARCISVGADTDSYEAAVSSLKAAAEQLSDSIVKRNEETAVPAPEIDKQLMEMSKALIDATDYYDEWIVTNLEHRIHMNNLGLLETAKECLTNGDISSAVNKALVFLGLSAVPYFYGREAGNLVNEIYQDEDSMFFQKGRIVSKYILTDLMVALREKMDNGSTDVKDEIAELERQIAQVKVKMRDSMDREVKDFKHIETMMAECQKLF